MIKIDFWTVAFAIAVITALITVTWDSERRKENVGLLEESVVYPFCMNGKRAMFRVSLYSNGKQKHEIYLLREDGMQVEDWCTDGSLENFIINDYYDDLNSGDIKRPTIEHHGDWYYDTSKNGR